jgi:hypothetical protein
MTRSLLSRAGGQLLALCIVCGSAAAEGEPAAPASSTATATPEARPAIEKTVDQIGNKIGEKIDEAIGEKTVGKIDEVHEDEARYFGLFFEKLDRVFGEEYVEDRDRKLQLRAGFETIFNDHGVSTDTKAKIVLRVPLPAMKRRFNAFIDIGEAADQLGDVTSPSVTASEKAFSLAAGLVRRIRDDLEAGIKLKLFKSADSLVTIYPFLRYEARPAPMRYFFEQQVIWQSDNTWHTLTDFQVDRRFGSLIFLRFRTVVDYSFEDPGAAIAHGLITRRSLFEDNGLSFELWLDYNTAKDDPTTITDDTIVYGQLRLRGRVWRKWLEYELRPIYTFPIATDRKSFFGFFVSLSVVWDSYLGGGAVSDAALNR